MRRIRVEDTSNAHWESQHIDFLTNTLHALQNCQYLASRIYSNLSSNILQQRISESTSRLYTLYLEIVQHVKRYSICLCFRLESLHLTLWLTRNCCDASSCRQFRPISSSLSTEVPSGKECEECHFPRTNKWLHLQKALYHISVVYHDLLLQIMELNVSLSCKIPPKQPWIRIV